MPALTFVPNHFTTEFESSFDMALQQMDSRLRGTVKGVQGSGERVRGNILGTVATTNIVGRGGATVNTDISSTEPNIFPQPAEVSNLFDEWDEDFLGQVVLPESNVVRAHAMAVNRNIDSTIISALTGTAYRGKNGTTATALPSSQQVSVSTGSTGSTGLNFEKISYAKYLLDEAEAPENDRYIGMRARQMKDLIDDIFANHTNDMQSIRMLEGNKVILEILGFRVVRSELFLTNSSDVTSCPAWQKDQASLAVWTDRKTYIDIRADLRHALQIRTVVNVGATREQDLGVVEILCDQTV